MRQSFVLSAICCGRPSTKGMAEVRERLKIEVAEAVRAGELTWDDRRSCLESFDDHPCLIEGQEALQEQVLAGQSAEELDIVEDAMDGASDEDHDPAPDAKMDEDADLDDEEINFGGSAASSSASAAAAISSPAAAASSSSAAAASSSSAKSGKPMLDTDAPACLDAQIDGLQQMVAIARATNQISLVNDLENRLGALLKANKTINTSMRLSLRTAAVKRKEAMLAHGAAAKATEREHATEMQQKAFEIQQAHLVFCSGLAVLFRVCACGLTYSN